MALLRLGPLAVALAASSFTVSAQPHAQWILLGDPSGQLAVTTSAAQATVIGQ